MLTTPSRMRSVAAYLWGDDVQSQRKLAPGVVLYSTAGHGGIVVSTELFDLHPKLRGLFSEPVEWTRGGETVLSMVGFEEDCDVSILFHFHPELADIAVKKGIFPATIGVRELVDGKPVEVRRQTIHEYDRDVVQRWHPELLEEVA